MKFAAPARPLRPIHALLTVAVLVLAAGCGSDDEAAVPAPPPPVDLAQLDVGPYSTQPRDFGKVKNMTQAQSIEASRLAKYVPLPMEIDARLVHTSPMTARVFTDTTALNNMLGFGDERPDRFKAGAQDLIAGVVSLAGNKPHDLGFDLANIVMIFPDEQKAAAAATAMEHNLFELDSAHEPVQLPKYPAAHAHWKPGEQAINSWYATGRLVVYTWMYDYAKLYLKKTDKAALVDIVQQSLDKVVPAVSGFTPTPFDKLMDLDVDPDAMLRRTVQRPDTDSWLDTPGVYDARTTLLFSENPESDRALFERLGVDRMADYGTRLYRTRDAASADALRDELVSLGKRFTASDAPKNLPAARCVEYIGRQHAAFRYYCAVSHDNYAAWFYSEQLTDVHQRISAQYALLVNAR